MKIGIISAMQKEHRQLASRLNDGKECADGPFHYVEGRLNDNEVILTPSGIGKANAAIGTAELLRRYRPDCIISTGVAGGMDACLQVTDVVVSNLRHFEALTRASESLTRVIEGLHAQLSGDFVSQDLRETIHHLSDIIGEVTPDSVLHTIFREFCVGK